MGIRLSREKGAGPPPARHTVTLRGSPRPPHAPRDSSGILHPTQKHLSRSVLAEHAAQPQERRWNILHTPRPSAERGWEHQELRTGAPGKGHGAAAPRAISYLSQGLQQHQGLSPEHNWDPHHSWRREKAAGAPTSVEIRMRPHRAATIPFLRGRSCSQQGRPTPDGTGPKNHISLGLQGGEHTLRSKPSFLVVLRTPETTRRLRKGMQSCSQPWTPGRGRHGRRTLHHDHQPEEPLPSHLTPRHQRFPLLGPE